ncbi:negative regulator of systemic acquired resistance (SNI1) [Artemisia annua]|uniref:Negative regulator of systemic acquired resistance (SNI1) n=1 Tax=Artemisia annua TaxID=35608 RepID=A0A2U1M5U8_ARTAN|nr:negative regulator of systemic acquired resistance (SNI1) [Artemisia annua]
MGTKRRRGGDGGMEENTMAILDTSCFSKSTQHVADDRLAFLEAVRSGFLVPENAAAPTNEMYKAIFQILKDENSLDLIMSSYQLLLELDKRFPRVYFSVAEKSESSSSLLHDELVVVEEAWSPYSLGTDVSSSAKQQDHNKTSGSFDATAFHLLIEDLAKVPDDVTTEETGLKRLRNMLLFQYLVNVLEGDFIPRNKSFKENSKWTTLRDSLLSMILVSRKINFKGLIKECLSTLCELSQFSIDSSHDVRPPESGSTEVTERCHAALAIALPEVVKRTCDSVQKLLSMIIELDSSKMAADMDGLTTRADGTRTPATEIILEELTYDKDILFPFFQALDKPKLKLDMIVQYFQKYIPKTSVRTRRSNGCEIDSTFGGMLKCFSDGNSTKSIIKKITNEAAQLLLAHAFQAYILLPSQQSTESNKGIVDNSLPEICNNMVSAFACLKKTDSHTGILPFGKEALLTAAIMLSKS